MERRPSLLRAMVLLNTLTVDLTRAAAGALGEAHTPNARIALVVTLYQRPGVTPSGLAAALGRHPSAVARDLSRLADEGLVAFTPDARDGRVRHVALTREGAERVKALRSAVEAVFRSRGPLVDEAVDLLSPESSPRGVPVKPTFDTLNALARAGARFNDDVRHVQTRFGLSARIDRFALLLIADRPGARPSTLVEELRMSTAAASEAITRLEGQGLVCRGASVADGRAVLVAPTARGRRAVGAIVDVMERHATGIAEGFRTGSG